MCHSMCVMVKEQLAGVRSLPPSAMWALGIKLRSSGSYGKSSYSLGHLVGPKQHNSKVSFKVNS